MNSRSPWILALLCATFLSGCSWINPYHENALCRARDGEGRCVDVQTSYADAKYEEFTDNIPPTPTMAKQGGIPYNGDPAGRHLYEDRVYRQMAAMIEDPPTPILTPPKILRVCFRSYEGRDGGLYESRFAFIQVDDPKWVPAGDLIETISRY